MRKAIALVLLLASQSQALDPCPADLSRDNAVTIDELVVAVDASLHGCPSLCPGDCDGDRTVSDADLATIEAIAAGDADIAECTAVDTDGDCSLRLFEELDAIQQAAEGECEE